MKTYEIYFHDLKPELQQKIVRERGYESVAEYCDNTNEEISPFAVVETYDKGEEPREARTTTMLNAILIPDLFDPASYGLFNDAQGTPLATIRTQDGQLYAFHAETGKLLTKRENAKAGTDLLAFAEHVRHMLEEPRQARQEMTVSLGLF